MQNVCMSDILMGHAAIAVESETCTCWAVH